jgi:hypothetical protein
MASSIAKVRGQEGVRKEGGRRERRMLDIQKDMRTKRGGKGARTGKQD